MTFTYTPGAPDDTTRIRFHVGDTEEAGAILSDETIAFAIAEAGGWKAAVVWCIDYIITQLALEDGHTLDWLTLDRADAMKYYERLKAVKRRQLGVGTGGVSASVTRTVRWDTPTYYDPDDMPDA